MQARLAQMEEEKNQVCYNSKVDFHGSDEDSISFPSQRRTKRHPPLPDPRVK
jgi:hypothetical protein